MLYVLYEHATGYGLFHIKEVEEVGALLPTVERAITEASLFKTIAKLVAFSPFKSGTNALDNVNAISEGIVHDDLKLFLETNVPTGKKGKKSGVELGVSDARISATIQEELGIKCAGGEAVSEIIRGLRLHFSNLVKGLTPLGEAKSQLGLGHSYSRAKVKFNVHRADNMIIQSIALLDQLDKDINTFSMRVREWYSYHFPELVKIINDNYMYCRMVKLIKNRKTLSSADDELMEKMEEITMDSAKAKAIVDASKMSMGMDISPIDLINIESFSSRVISLTEYRKSLVKYLHDRMGSVAPNLASLIGDMVGARLISHAGSLTNLAKYPASTVQILGAEKALFRALKTKGNTPKYGLIFHSTFIGRAAAKNKGRISRFLANKCSMASRIDCFAEKPSNIFGEKLKEQVEERLKFFETGDAPRKNVDVMKEALEEFANLADSEASAAEDTLEVLGEKKKKKKKKKRKTDVDDDIIAMIATPAETTNGEQNGVIAEPEKKKKKKSKGAATTSDQAMEVTEQSTINESAMSTEEENQEKKTKKKKKKKANTTAESAVEDVSVVEQSIMSVDEEGEEKKKKKKKEPKKTAEDQANDSAVIADETILAAGGEVAEKKKKKKRKSEANKTSQGDDTVMSVEESEPPKKKKKKKKLEGTTLEESSVVANQSVKVNGSSIDESQPENGKSGKKKKKKNKTLDASIDVSIVADETETPKKVKKAKKKKVIVIDE